MTKKNKIILGLCFIIYLFVVKRFNIGIPCLFYKYTHLYCPGCGITRMFLSLLKFDIYKAFRCNPLVFILLCLYLLIKIFKVKKIPKNITYILLVIVIIYGFLRNLETFSFLRPII